MRCTVLVVSILALATLPPRCAAAAGVSLRWDNCTSDGGVANKTFACDTNTGSERLVMSFVLGSDMVQVSGTEIRLFIVPASATLPSWWEFKNAGTCRTTALTLSFAPPSGVTCADWSNGIVSGGIGSYTNSLIPAPNGVQLLLAAAVPPTALADLFADQEYLAGTLVISHAKTVGAGACGGCDQPVCIVLDRLNVTTPVLANNVFLFGPAFGAGGDFAHWQNGQETNTGTTCGQNSGCSHQFSCQLSSTPTRASTWGAVKALYR